MSYVIVYDRQVIKTPTGYSFVILHGDNNVWEDNKKRARDWNCWILNKSIEEINKYFSSWHKGYEHFEYNGKFIDDAGLDKWVKTGIQNAKTIEEIQMLRPGTLIECNLGVWQNSNYRTELNVFVHNTDEYLDWINKANVRLSNKAADESIYINVGFSNRNPLRLGNIPSGPVILKRRNQYVIEVNEQEQTWKTCSCEIEKAIVFDSFEKVLPYLRYNSGSNYPLKVVSANIIKLQQQKDFVIKIIDENNKDIGYYMSANKAGMRHSFYVSSAKKFTKTQANATIKRLQNRNFNRKLSFIVVNASKD